MDNNYEYIVLLTFNDCFRQLNNYLNLFVGCDKFKVAEIAAVVYEEDGTEYDASCLSLVPDNTIFMILCPEETWRKESNSQTSGGEGM